MLPSLLSLLLVAHTLASPLHSLASPFLVQYLLPTSPVVLEVEVDYQCAQEGVFVNPEDCGSYFVCNNNGYGIMATKVSCPGAGDNSLAFNEELGFCDWSHRVPGCEPEDPPMPPTSPLVHGEVPPRGLETEPILVDPTIDYTCSEEGVFYNPEDCQSYVSCNERADDGYKAVKISCLHGLFFNQELKVCDYPVNVLDCAARTVATTPAPPTQPVVACETDPATGRIKLPCTSPVMACEDGTFRASCEPETDTWWWTVEESPEDFDCSGKSVGTYEDPEDCSKYFVCSGDGRSFRYSCAEGTVYDVDTRECVFGDAAACGTRKVTAYTATKAFFGH